MSSKEPDANGKEKSPVNGQTPKIRKPKEPKPKLPVRINKNGKVRLANGEAKRRMAAAGVDGICQRIRNGEMLMDIAESLGVDAGSLSSYLSSTPEARQESARAYRDSAEVMLNLGMRALLEAKDGDAARVQWGRAMAQEWARVAGIRNAAYRERSGVELTGPGGGPVQTETLIQVYLPQKQDKTIG